MALDDQGGIMTHSHLLIDRVALDFVSFFSRRFFFFFFVDVAGY